MKRIISLGVFVLVAVAFFSCEKENIYDKSRRLELEELKQYIEKVHPDIEPKPSGLYFIELEKGYGDTIKYGDRVQIYYETCILLDSLKLVVVDETTGYSLGQRYEPLELMVGSSNFITGLSEGLTYMQPGARAKLIINSNLAYGQSGAGLVPGFTTLIMEVEVYKVYPLSRASD